MQRFAMDYTTFPEHMRPAQAAEYLAVSKSFLDQARVAGTGPRFVKISSSLVIYRRTDLDAWLAARVIASTSETVSRW
jgi:predicted DNA-binding transcriptional regulator AlpA